MAHIDELKLQIRKLNAKATQAKMDLHDLSEELPTNWERIPEVARAAHEAHAALIAAALDDAQQRGVVVVSAARQDETRWYPGSLHAALGVVADATVPRDALDIDAAPDAVTHELLVRSSPYPRPIEGLPAHRNLTGVSFAVANATGIIARAREAGAPSDVAGLLQWLAQAGAAR